MEHVPGKSNTLTGSCKFFLVPIYLRMISVFKLLWRFTEDFVCFTIFFAGKLNFSFKSQIEYHNMILAMNQTYVKVKCLLKKY